MEPRLRELFGREIAYAGRNASASPAVGALAMHKREQACLVAEAFDSKAVAPGFRAVPIPQLKLLDITFDSTGRFFCA